MDELRNTPYILMEDAAKDFRKAIQKLEKQCEALRQAGTLSEETLRQYYGRNRFEQVAASNALEGSTLDVGETELAILKGVTITGHDPAFVRDARDLDRALTRLYEMAHENAPTDIGTLRELHNLILGERPGAGMIRSEPVRIAGASHHPPKGWKEVMHALEEWEQWSKERKTLPAPLRAIVLHAWLTRIHPFIDGNGRLARAVGNLELVRGGYPPIIIRRRERERYLRALADSDEGGDIRSFAELILERLEGALQRLVQSAEAHQDYDPLASAQERLLRVWNSAVVLLAESLQNELERRIEKDGGKIRLKIYAERVREDGIAEILDLESYRLLCRGQSASHSWAFTFRVDVPGFAPYERLVWTGYRSKQLRGHMKGATGVENGPALYWSASRPDAYPRWHRDPEPPYAGEMTIREGYGDEWHVLTTQGKIECVPTSLLGRRIASAVVETIGGGNPPES